MPTTKKTPRSRLQTPTKPLPTGKRAPTKDGEWRYEFAVKDCATIILSGHCSILCGVCRRWRPLELRRMGNGEIRNQPRCSTCRKDLRAPDRKPLELSGFTLHWHPGITHGVELWETEKGVTPRVTVRRSTSSKDEQEHYWSFALESPDTLPLLRANGSFQTPDKELLLEMLRVTLATYNRLNHEKLDQSKLGPNS